MNELTKRALRILLAFFLIQPVLAFLHEILIVIVAALVNAIANADFFYDVLKQFLASPIHAKIMLETLGGVRADGIAIAGIPGQILHFLFPVLFVDPNVLSTSAWINAVIDKNSTVLGFFITQALTEFLSIIAGLILFRFSLKKQSVWTVLRTASVVQVTAVLGGLYVAAQSIALAFSLTMSPALAGLRETGIGVGLSLFMQIDKTSYNWLMDQALPLFIPSILILTAIGTCWLMCKSIDRIQLRLAQQSPTKRTLTARLVRKANYAGWLAPLLIVSFLSLHYFGMANTAWLTKSVQVAEIIAPQPPPPIIAIAATSTPELPTLPTALATPTSIQTLIATATPTSIQTHSATVTLAPTTLLSPTPTPTLAPTQVRQRIVELRRANKKFSLVVNDRPVYLKGVNYNVNYTALPDDVKRRFHNRDFQIMQNAGINAIIGWGVYDRVTIDIANQYGIGVIMPFELDARGAFENKIYREQIKEQYRKFILEYKDSPAVWGWNPGGDELLHRMEIDNHRTPDKLQSAADFLLELSTQAYTLDPTRVSIIKEPRDLYVPYVEESVRRARMEKPTADPSKYFIFAANTYGKPEGVAQVLNVTRQSVEERVGIAFLVGEFAPFGMARSERATQYVDMWNTVEQVSSIGGFAYVYGPDQPNPKAPNPYDPLRLLVSEFSLMDIDGNPVDGSWNALATQWHPLPTLEPTLVNVPK